MKKTLLLLMVLAAGVVLGSYAGAQEPMLALLHESFLGGSSFGANALGGFQSSDALSAIREPFLSYGASGTGVGNIEAFMIVTVNDGQTQTRYDTYSSASGVWSFSKSMEYQSSFPRSGTSSPFDRIFSPVP